MSRYSPESRAPAVKVLGYFLLVTSVLAVFTRLCTKLWKFRTIFRDDYFVIASLLLSIGQSAAVFIAVDNGYGEYMATLSDAQIHIIMVSQYSATLLYIASVCFSKLSLVSFVGYLSPSSHDRLFSIGAHVAVGVWAVIGIFASAFQCHPHPWSYLHDTCINREAWFTYLGISNIVTDLAIVAQAIKIIVGIQTNLQRKATLMAVFFFRLVVTGAIVARIVTIYNTPETADPTRDTWATSVSTQLIQCLSIVTASVPQLIPFLRNLNSSGMELGGMTRHMASSSQGKSTKSKSFLSILGRSRTENRSGHELGSVHKPMNKTFVTTASKTAGSRNDPDIASQSSQAGIIRETRTWAVTTEERATSMENTRDGMGMGRESPLIG